METVTALGGMGTLVAFALVKAYTGNTLARLRAACQNAMAQERYKRQEKEREEELLETSEARLRQLDADKDRLQKDLEGLRRDTEEAEGRLNKLKGDEEEEEGDEGRDQ